MLFESKFDPCTDFTTGNPLIESFLDSDGAGFKPARKSTTSGVIVIGSRVACHSVRNQKCVSLSSCEAEYLAMAAVTSEATLSVARTLAHRWGVGRARHLSTKVLWLQTFTKHRAFEFLQHPLNYCRCRLKALDGFIGLDVWWMARTSWLEFQRFGP